ncbi:MAG: glucosamine kinase [Cognaticolwellia sp.]|jgi:glucosamine kinase
MHLIADSGSTKTAWRLIKSKNTILKFETIGYSPQYITTSEMISDLIAVLVPQLRITSDEVTKISFYGTGCSTSRTVEIIQSALESVFEKAAIEVNHDLLGAARALCGHSAGVACILGTGANSCLYDGRFIIDNIPSVGFMLGDEGSGGYLGKKLIRAYFYRELPMDLEADFNKQYGLNRDDMLLNVYKKPMPNRYLASYTKFLSQHLAHPFVWQLVKSAFQDFLDSMILKYENIHDLPINFLGSIAVHFQTALKEVLIENKLKFGRIVENPVEEMVNYHLE